MHTFTAGPWRVYHEIFRAELSDKKIIEVQDTNSRPIVKWTGFDGVDRPKKENLANARLIAAAPDLLDLLKSAIARVELANAEGNNILSAWLPDARAAIARAAGGE